MLTQTKTTNMIRRTRHVRKARKQHDNKAKQHMQQEKQGRDRIHRNKVFLIYLSSEARDPIP